ncbi:SHOCT domain-containing protein, partial [Spinactinospora alkalitolerans]
AGAPPAGPPAAPPAGPAAAASAAPGGTQRLLDELRQLGELRDSGVITPEEFDRLKDRLIGDI